MNNIFPQLPHNLMLQDYMRGKRSPLYIDSEGVHQYEKWLVLVRHVQQCNKIYADNYKGLRRGNYDPNKLNRDCHDSSIKMHGISIVWQEYYFD